MEKHCLCHNLIFDTQHLNVLTSVHFLIESEPNVGIVNVPDKRLDVLGEIHNSVKVIPAAVSVLILNNGLSMC